MRQSPIVRASVAKMPSGHVNLLNNVGQRSYFRATKPLLSKYENATLEQMLGSVKRPRKVDS